MRFQILQPSSPFDPRQLSLTSLDALYAVAPPIDGPTLYSEDEAAAITRGMRSDSIPMPVLVAIGSGQTVLMGFIDEYKDKVMDKDAILPFTLFVRPVPEHNHDQRRLKAHAAFDPKKWRPQVKHPTAISARAHQVEVRSSELATPVPATALVGRTAGGVPVITVSIGDQAISITFDQAGEVTVTDPPRMVDPDVTATVAAAGVSFDPIPR